MYTLYITPHFVEYFYAYVKLSYSLWQPSTAIIKYFSFREKRRKESTTPGLPKWSHTLVLPRPDDV